MRFSIYFLNVVVFLLCRLLLHFSSIYIVKIITFLFDRCYLSRILSFVIFVVIFFLGHPIYSIFLLPDQKLTNLVISWYFLLDLSIFCLNIVISFWLHHVYLFSLICNQLLTIFFWIPIFSVLNICFFFLQHPVYYFPSYENPVKFIVGIFFWKHVEINWALF